MGRCLAGAHIGLRKRVLCSGNENLIDLALATRRERHSEKCRGGNERRPELEPTEFGLLNDGSSGATCERLTQSLGEVLYGETDD